MATDGQRNGHGRRRTYHCCNHRKNPPDDNRDRATPMCRRRRGPPGRTQALLPGTDCPAPRNPPDHHVVQRHDLMQSRGADGTET